MTQLVTRLILAILLLPITGSVFVALMVGVVASGPGPPALDELLFVWTVIYLFVGAYWTMLWRSRVRWNRTRVILTVFAAPAALLLGLAMGGICLAIIRGAPPAIAVLVGGAIVPIAWVVATVPIWKETRGERIERLSALGRHAVCCPICGYNLTGLHEARCLECGSRFTLDQLLASRLEWDEPALRDD